MYTNVGSVRLKRDAIIVIVLLCLGMIAADALIAGDDVRADRFFEQQRLAGRTGPLYWRRTAVYGGILIGTFDDGSWTTSD